MSQRTIKEEVKNIFEHLKSEDTVGTSEETFPACRDWFEKF